MSLADSRARHPYYYVGLPIFSIAILIVIAILLANDGVAAVEWQTLGTLLLPLGISVIVWVATCLTLRRNYKQNSALRDGTVYRLDEQGIIRKGITPEMVSWSDIARKAKQASQWILLRQAAATSGENYFLNTAGVMPPASRAELLALSKIKRIKPI